MTMTEILRKAFAKHFVPCLRTYFSLLLFLSCYYIANEQEKFTQLLLLYFPVGLCFQFSNFITLVEMHVGDGGVPIWLGKCIHKSPIYTQVIAKINRNLMEKMKRGKSSIKMFTNACFHAPSTHTVLSYGSDM